MITIIGTVLLSLGGLFLALGLAAILLGLMVYLFVLLTIKANVWVTSGITYLITKSRCKKKYGNKDEQSTDKVKCKNNQPTKVITKTITRTVYVEKKPTEVIIGNGK